MISMALSSRGEFASSFVGGFAKRVRKCAEEVALFLPVVTGQAIRLRPHGSQQSDDALLRPREQFFAVNQSLQTDHLEVVEVAGREIVQDLHVGQLLGHVNDRLVVLEQTDEIDALRFPIRWLFLLNLLPEFRVDAETERDVLLLAKKQGLLVSAVALFREMATFAEASVSDLERTNQ